MTRRTTDIAPQIRHSLAGIDGHTDDIGLRRILMGPNALDHLAEEVASIARNGPVVILEDRTPMRRGSDDLKSLIQHLLSTDSGLDRVALGPESGELHADAAALTSARRAVKDAGCVVTVGSGTITDIGKDASHANGGKPLVVVQTAPSVNGFSDDMAVVLKDGVKRTIPSAWPNVLLIDTQILQDCPKELIGSGYAEMMAMFTAPADWQLANVVGQDSSFQKAIVDLFRPKGMELLASANEISTGTGRALELLATLLTYSGIAMAVAGRTAPLSGTEHLISHLIDMSASAENLPTGLHGAQVGVGAVIASVIWSRLFDRIDPEQLARRSPDPADAEKTVRHAFATIDESGAMGEECWSDYKRKLGTWAERSSEVDLVSLWSDVLPDLRSVVGDPTEMVKALTDAGAPTRFSELDPPVDKDRARWVVGSAPLMRNRFTVLDLAAFTGNWTANDVDDVLELATELGGGW